MKIGHALVLRQLLKQALGNSIDAAVPALAAMADATRSQCTSSASVWRVRVSHCCVLLLCGQAASGRWVVVWPVA